MGAGEGFPMFWSLYWFMKDEGFTRQRTSHASRGGEEERGRDQDDGFPGCSTLWATCQPLPVKRHPEGFTVFLT